MCKMIQYGCRCLMYHLRTNPEVSVKFKNLFENMRDARKLFRLFKSLNELKKLEEILMNSSKTPDEITLLLRKVTRNRGPNRVLFLLDF